MGGASPVGRLVGQNGGTFSASDWDAGTTNQACAVGNTSCGAVQGTTGLATSDAFLQSKYTGFDFTNSWYMVDGQTRPFMRSEYSSGIANVDQLQPMALDPSAAYTLVADIDATATAGAIAADMWGQRGFVPVVNNGTPFDGVFDGTGHTISNLTIARSGTDYVGLFGASHGLIGNVGLVGGSMTGCDFVGGRAGRNEGTVIGPYTTGAVTGNSSVGGLVGNNSNTGKVLRSYATTASGGALSGPATGNYVFDYETGTMEVAARPITVEADDQAMRQGQAVPALRWTIVTGDLVNGDHLSGGLTTKATKASRPGSYAIAQGTPAASENYAMTYVPGILAVTPSGRDAPVAAPPPSWRRPRRSWT
ncbi:MBG domain-containing protein [Xanthobacter sediminis]